MSFRPSLNVVTLSVVATAFLLTTYLYLYPALLGCAFPSSHGSILEGYRDTVTRHFTSNPSPSNLAPFRLLVLADPQLEGDSSLPDPEDAFTRKLSRHRYNITEANTTQFREVLWESMQQIVVEDIPEVLWTLRKRLDLFGNDYYLAHIFRTLHWWSNPTHVTVLGDLIGSQWVSDDEFEWRGWRFWNRVFEKGQKIEDEIMSIYEKENAKDIMLPLGEDKLWERRIINIAGNHDIGYAGDITRERMHRFEKIFGRANWDLRFVYPNVTNSTPPSLHLIVLNDMLFDTPALDESLQGENYDYVNALITSRLSSVENRNSTFTLLLTHVPLYKPEGVCVDAPFFDFYDSSDGGGVYRPHGLKEQNHLSDHSSHAGILESIFGMSTNQYAAAGGKGRNGLILSGHDHEGCDVWHYLPTNVDDPVTEAQNEEHEVDKEDEQKKTKWRSVRTSQFNPSTANMHTGIREVTLRSMMGSYSGNAGLLSLWYDFERQTWDYEIQMCALGVQHIWWATHVLDMIAVLLLGVQAVLKVRSMITADDGKEAEIKTRAMLKKTQ